MSVCVAYEKAGQAEGFDKVVLLSGSPRRRELLAFLNPTIQIPSIDEQIVSVAPKRFAASRRDSDRSIMMSLAGE